MLRNVKRLVARGDHRSRWREEAKDEFKFVAQHERLACRHFQNYLSSVGINVASIWHSKKAITIRPAGEEQELKSH